MRQKSTPHSSNIPNEIKRLKIIYYLGLTLKIQVSNDFSSQLIPEYLKLVLSHLEQLITSLAIIKHTGHILLLPAA